MRSSTLLEKTGNQRFSKQHAYSVLARGVRDKLNQLIKGNIYSYVIDDTLYVDIHTHHDTCFRFSLSNISTQIVHGMDSSEVTRLVFKKYDKYIKSLYFL